MTMTMKWQLDKKSHGLQTILKFKFEKKNSCACSINAFFFVCFNWFCNWNVQRFSFRLDFILMNIFHRLDGYTLYSLFISWVLIILHENKFATVLWICAPLLLVALHAYSTASVYGNSFWIKWLVFYFGLNEQRALYHLLQYRVFKVVSKNAVYPVTVGSNISCCRCCPCWYRNRERIHIYQILKHIHTQREQERMTSRLVGKWRCDSVLQFIHQAVIAVCEWDFVKFFSYATR